MNESQFEMAEKYTELQVTEGIDKAKIFNKPQYHPDFDGVTCVECGDDIPHERLAMSKVRCTSCQELIEMKQKTRG